MPICQVPFQTCWAPISLVYCCVQYIVWHLRCAPYRSIYSWFLCKKDYSISWLQLQHFKWTIQKTQKASWKENWCISWNQRKLCYFQALRSELPRKICGEPCSMAVFISCLFFLSTKGKSNENLPPKKKTQPRQCEWRSWRKVKGKVPKAEDEQHREA